MVNLLIWLLSRKSWIESPGVPNLGAMPTGLHQGILCGPIQFTSQLRIAGGIVHVVAGAMCKSYRYHPDLYLSYLKRQLMISNSRFHGKLLTESGVIVPFRLMVPEALEGESTGPTVNSPGSKKPALDDLFIGFHTAHEGAGKI